MKLKSVKAKLPKSVKRITILKADAQHSLSGRADRIIVGKKKKKEKKSKGLLRIWERVVRRGAQAGSKATDTYLDRHKRSNRKRRDGWIRDLAINNLRAGRKGAKKFKLSKLF